MSDALVGHDSEQLLMMEELCILVDARDRSIGSASKREIHLGEGQRHRAFSVLIFDSDERLLIQRRSDDKITFPGVWANSCCSHPLDVEGENEGSDGVKNAAIRKMEQELGIPQGSIHRDELIPMTRMEYRARWDDHWVEHEIDHILICQSDVAPNPNPNEISEVRWVTEDELDTMAEKHRDGELTLAPWFDLIRTRFLTGWWRDLDAASSMVDLNIHDFTKNDDLGLYESHRIAVEERIGAALSKTVEPRLHAAMKHLFQGGGKRLRAVLPSIVAEAVGNHVESAYDLGAAIEIIHNFTLVHDDIMDGDSIRRGRPSVHVAYDMPTAINAGDAMLAVSFEILAESNRIEPELFRNLVRIIGQMVRRVSEGQQMDMDFENREHVSEQDYLEMISGKTAAMFETCALTGAMLAGATSDVLETCRTWGLEVGLCFQLMDDLIDVTGDTETLGKPACSDIIEGKRTLIAIDALAQPADSMPLFLSHFGSHADEVDRGILDGIVLELESSGSIERARNSAMSHHSAAHRCLDELPVSLALDALRHLTDWQLKRIS